VATTPSSLWRAEVLQEASALAAGTLSPDKAFMTQLFPVAMLDSTDVVLAAFEADVSRLEQPSDQRVLDAVEKVVLALNAVNDAFDGSAYETGERELLCDFIDATLSEHGVDVPALAARQGLHRYALTDRWRCW
jgi:hypothetical protein